MAIRRSVPMTKSAYKRVLLLAVVVLAMGTGEAVAAPLTPEMEAAYQRSLLFWGGGDPPGCSSVERQVVPRTENGGNRGTATQPEPGTIVPCILRISDDLGCAAEEEAVMEHEVGHLFGHGHSENPADSMYPGRPSPCAATPAPTSTYERDRHGELAWRLKQLRGVQRSIPRIRAQCRALSERQRCWATVDRRKKLLETLRSELVQAQREIAQTP
jgi:hypothetical protein